MAKQRAKPNRLPSSMVRQEEVATRAGVSTSTVSRALTRPDLVSEETRVRVLKAVHELGYAPNQLARSLRRQGSRTIGLIISDILVPFHSEVAKGAEDVANQHGYSLILCNAEENSSKEADYIALLRGFQVAGIIIEPTRNCAASIEQLLQSGTRVVEVDRISGAKGVLSVLSDNGGGARLAAEHLLKLGHRSFAVIAGDTQVTSNQERLEGFRQGLKTRGIALDDSRVALCPNTPEGGYRSARQLLGSKPPSALFVLNAQMMAGAMQAIKELRFKIPGDISVVSFDDTQWSSHVDPPLTVVAQQPYGLGRTAASLILESIEGHQTTPGAKQVRLSTHLIERQSCNAARTDIAAK